MQNKEELYSKMKFVRIGGEVSRFHTLRTITIESVAQHSFGVAALCMIIWPRAPKSLLRAALIHDLAEHEVGDIPAPAKRALKIYKQMGKIEDRVLIKAGIHPAGLNQINKRRLKIADCLDGLLFCAREISLGNSRMNTIAERYLSYLAPLAVMKSEKAAVDAAAQILKESQNGNFSPEVNISCRCCHHSA